MDKGTPGAETGSGAKAPGKSAPSPASQQAAELLIGSKPLVDSEGPFDRYAKIRFDKATRSVVIQIISSGSGEVIREIPPGAWEKIGRGLLLSREKSAEEQR
ncbi:MAG: flagellar protein FlaG [Bacteroidetes bacterium]|nr:flagellar protein FlaG [Bacteroidota bacterium]MCL5025228.1 flagellar protein FlaG [Chloroflexota bacterium]